MEPDARVPAARAAFPLGIACCSMMYGMADDMSALVTMAGSKPGSFRDVDIDDARRVWYIACGGSCGGASNVERRERMVEAADEPRLASRGEVQGAVVIGHWRLQPFEA